jgi:predicted nucleic acid-binding protein
MSLSSRCTFDTNILFYAIDSSAGEKHRAAKQLLTLANRDNTVIVLQTLGELFHSIHRKHPQQLPVARDFIDNALALFDIIASDAQDLTEALVIQQQHSIQFWDALILVTAQRASCPILFSEDFQDGQVFGPLTVRNPFTMTREAIDSLFT